LPDCVIVDIGKAPPTSWTVEAVASDDEID